MTTEPRAAKEEGGPTRGAGRALLPVLLNVVLLGLVIHLGVERNRGRVRSNRERLDDAVSTLREYCDSAVQALVSGQEGDGSWSYDRSPSRSFERADSTARVASTMRILLNVRGTAYEEKPFYAAGMDYVRKHQRTASPQPTLELVALRWLLLGAELQSVDELRALLRTQTTPGELYGPSHAEPSGERPESSPSRRLGDNLLLLGVLPALDVDPSSIETGIRHYVDHTSLTPSSWLSSAYLASLAAESGSLSARSLVDRFLEEFKSGAGPDPWESLDNLSIAAFVKVQADQCLLERDPCGMLNAAVRALVARRRADGSWEPGASTGHDNDFAGSTAETTSLALKALTRFRQILENRAAFQNR